MELLVTFGLAVHVALVPAKLQPPARKMSDDFGLVKRCTHKRSVGGSTRCDAFCSEPSLLASISMDLCSCLPPGSSDINFASCQTWKAPSRLSSLKSCSEHPRPDSGLLKEAQGLGLCGLGPSVGTKHPYTAWRTPGKRPFAEMNFDVDTTFSYREITFRGWVLGHELLKFRKSFDSRPGSNRTLAQAVCALLARIAAMHEAELQPRLPKLRGSPGAMLVMAVLFQDGKVSSDASMAKTAAGGSWHSRWLHVATSHFCVRRWSREGAEGSAVVAARTDMPLCRCHGYGEEKVKINDTSATPSNQTLAVVGVFCGRRSLSLLALATGKFAHCFVNVALHSKKKQVPAASRGPQMLPVHCLLPQHPVLSRKHASKSPAELSRESQVGPHQSIKLDLPSNTTTSSSPITASLRGFQRYQMDAFGLLQRRRHQDAAKASFAKPCSPCNAALTVSLSMHLLNWLHQKVISVRGWRRNTTNQRRSRHQHVAIPSAYAVCVGFESRQELEGPGAPFVHHLWPALQSGGSGILYTSCTAPRATVEQRSLELCRLQLSTS
ncbi:hypothetical protein Anapl_17776 [Anas platyrhynchos]|uniref:Uncharacterized protein n=1 Tax=Anas platyrhynchos TaxID=8839 RepID=R0J8R6_ANAPL|nr:hypothetical protein Anapl_17776 [Anas platyrhynchos]